VNLHDLLDLVLRWAHLIAGIMWIGNSMLFNWLDRNLERSTDAGRLSQGRIWMVHSGAFYETEKKLLEPRQLPDRLHWFKWQNGITWLTGISLLVVVYFMNDAAFLIDPQVRALGTWEAIGYAIGALVAGWVIYDLLWLTLGDTRPGVATALSILLLAGAAYGFTQVFSGRAAYIETGVLIGTIMTGNVWARILPSQRELIAATRTDRDQDPTLSLRAKQRSIHNNYLTFPLLFIMVSNHFDDTWGHHLNWLILIVVMVGSAAVRHYMNVRYAGATWLGPAIAAAVLTLTGVVVLTRVEERSIPAASAAVAFPQVQKIIMDHCVSCHSRTPTDPIASAVPKDVTFDDPADIKRWAQRIHDRAAVLRTMPFNNKTMLTDDEIGALKRWFADGASVE
jgi:uncharacterized membrane protein